MAFGGLGSVWGVVLRSSFLLLLQSWWVVALSGWVRSFGAAVGSRTLVQDNLTRGTELIFGVILVGMMLYLRDGLIPAVGRTAAMTHDQQNAEVWRGVALVLPGLGGQVRDALPVQSTDAVTVRFGGLVTLNAVSIAIPRTSAIAAIGRALLARPNPAIREANRWELTVAA